MINNFSNIFIVQKVHVNNLCLIFLIIIFSFSKYKSTIIVPKKYHTKNYIKSLSIGPMPTQAATLIEDNSRYLCSIHIYLEINNTGENEQ